MIDFSPVRNGDIQYIEFARHFSLQDLRAATKESVATLRSFVEGLTDADIIFAPIDPDAHDPYAIAGGEHIGWNLGHLVAHVTATSEEGAAISSLLARGFASSERPRYEIPWRQMTTVAKCIQRLEESRRIRLAYLDTWPDQPFLNTHRNVSEKFTAHFGPMNAPAAYLFALGHEVGHYDQFREVRRQALAARAATV